MRAYMVRICSEEPQADKIIVGDVVGTKWKDGIRGIVVGFTGEEQYKVVTKEGNFEDWINPCKFGANYDIYTLADVFNAVIDL